VGVHFSAVEACGIFVVVVVVANHTSQNEYSIPENI